MVLQIINGALLKDYIGQNVSLLVKAQSNEGVSSLKAQTTDSKDVQISLTEALNSTLDGWVEVIGVPSGPNAIKGKEIIVFEEKENAQPFDASAHNMLVKLLREFKGDPYEFEDNGATQMDEFA